MSKAKFSVGRDNNGELDEIFLKATHVHIERMDTMAFWVGVNLPDGSLVHMRTGVAGGVWYFNVEGDGQFETVQRPSSANVHAVPELLAALKLARPYILNAILGPECGAEADLAAIDAALAKAVPARDAETMTPEEQSQRDLNPTPEAVFAMFHWDGAYARLGLGAMEYYDQMGESNQQYCKEAVSRIMAAAKAKSGQRRHGELIAKGGKP